MELVKITELTGMLGITSRSLRYYEQAGLIRSVRPDSGKYRYYDAANIERLRQILVLRKMQIPVKDILRIYESEDMSVVVETFVSRIRAIDEEVNALTDLRRIVNDFLTTMTRNGITKISALPLLYESMEKQLDSLENNRTGSYKELASISDRLTKPVQPSLVQLPPMRILSSCLKENSQISDVEGFSRWVQMHGIPSGRPGAHERFDEKCGYASTFVSLEQLCSNREMYLQTLMAYIDKGVPVIAVTRFGGDAPWGIYAGYEEYGRTLLYLSGDKTEPERIPAQQAIDEQQTATYAGQGWLFIGEKKRTVDLAQVYRNIIIDMPRLLTVKTDGFCFGPEAFRAWAESIESGKFDAMSLESFEDGWDSHISNICNMATNGSCVFTFLDRARELNPDFAFLEDIGRQYRRTAEIWNNDNGND